MTTTFKPVSRIPSDEQIQEDFQRSRIYRAIRKGDSQRLLAAINRGANIHLYDHDQLFTFLHLVVLMANPNTEDKFLPMIYILSNYEVEINAQDTRGRTALELAIHKELRHIMVALIRVGTDLTDRDYKSMIHRIHGQYQPELLDYFEKYEPGLWGAIKRNNMGQTQLLLNSWCRVNTVKNNKTLIDYANLTRKSPDLIKVLIDSEISLEFVHATLAGDERMMHELLDKDGCDPYTMDISHHESGTDTLTPRSLRDTAIAMGHRHILHLLPDSENSSDEFDACVNEHHLDDDVIEHDVLPDYPESPTMPTPKLRLDLSNLDLEEKEYGQNDTENSHCPDYESKGRQPPKKPSRKYKNRFYQNGDATKAKNRQNYPADEGYNSTVSSIRSVSTNQSETDTTRFDMGYGHYKKYYDNCYYYTEATEKDSEDTPEAMMVLTTPRGVESRGLDSRSRTKKSLKGSSVKSKGRKQRARIYWQDENSEGDAIPVPKPRKTKRSKSMRISRKYDNEDDMDAKSRMCVIS